MMAQIIRLGGFPFLFFGSALAFYFSGFSPLAFYGIIATALLAAALLERILPYEPGWNHVQGDTGADILHFVMTTLVTTATKTLSVLIVSLLAGAFPARHALAEYMGQLSFGISLLPAVVLSGFLPYWVHRLSHEKDGLLWRLHAVHHSPNRLYWLNATRFHPLNALWNAFLSLFPLHFLGFSEPVLLMTGLLNNLVGIYNHANIDFRLGVLNRMFNMNELHRWHHAKDIETANHNYSAGCLSVWDAVFGTWYLPARRMRENEVGLQDQATLPVRSVAAQLCYPFCYKK